MTMVGLESWKQVGKTGTELWCDGCTEHFPAGVGQWELLCRWKWQDQAATEGAQRSETALEGIWSDGL